MRQDWPDDAAHRAAGAENQDLAVADQQPQVVDQVAGQADAVGVVAGEVTVGQENQRVDRAGVVRARAALIAQFRESSRHLNRAIASADDIRSAWQ